MIVSFGHVLVLSGLLFLLGTVCAVARRNLIMILLGVEIMLNAATIAFVGIALAVAVLISVMSIMQGFRTQLLDQLLGIRCGLRPYRD